MDEELKEALLIIGTILSVYSGFLGIILKFTKEPIYILYLSLFLVTFIWLFYLTLKVGKYEK